jgi:hypothetical protein
MILLTFAEKPETRDESFSCKAFRWALATDLVLDHKQFATLELVQQRQWKSSLAWESSHTQAFGISLLKSFAWGLKAFLL